MIQITIHKRHFLILGSILLLLLVCIIGSSYAYLYTKVEGQKTYNITVKGYNLTIEEKNTEQTIKIENGEPVTDEVGKTGVSYDFDLINRDISETGFIIYLDDERIDDEINRMKDINVRYQFIENGVEKVGLVSELGTNPFRILTSGVIGGGETNHYSLRFWIKEGSEIFTAQIFSVKLRVIGTSKEAIESGELTPGSIIVTSENGITQMTDEQLETYLNKNLEGKFTEFLNKNHPIGSIYFTLTKQNPAELFGGTWERYAGGKTLVGIDEANEKFNEVEKTGGNTNGEVTLSVEQLPSHNHNFTPSGAINSTLTDSKALSEGSEHLHQVYLDVFGSASLANAVNTSETTFNLGFAPTGGWTRGGARNGTLAASKELSAHTHTVTGTVTSTFIGTKQTSENTGSGHSISTQDPYVTVYMWKRVS